MGFVATYIITAMVADIKILISSSLSKWLLIQVHVLINQATQSERLLRIQPKPLAAFAGGA